MGKSQPPVIAIDGPSASGKGRSRRALRNALGFHYLDSGALYRAGGAGRASSPGRISKTSQIWQVSLLNWTLALMATIAMN